MVTNCINSFKNNQISFVMTIIWSKYFSIQSDPTVDIENLGNGVLVTYSVISGVLLLSYCLDGIYMIQSIFLETVRKEIFIFYELN